MSRKISLPETVEFYQMISDEKSNFDENLSEEADDNQLHKTLYGEPNNEI